MSTLIDARGLKKRYGKSTALAGVDLRIEEGRIVGLIGPNGAGKTTALKAILGLTSYEGELSVLGLNPYRERHRLMQNVCFVADVAVLPRWLRVDQALDFVEGVHPRFKRARTESFLAKTDIKSRSRVKELSKGMITQLHLALIMAIDAKLLVLDEPTLGLDIIYRKQFYDTLLNDYFDGNRTILVTTHQVEEIEQILTDIVFIDHGRIALDCGMDEIANRYVELMTAGAQAEEARKFNPISERQIFGKSVLIFENVARDKLTALGELRTPSIADLFVAKLAPTQAANNKVAA